MGSEVSSFDEGEELGDGGGTSLWAEGKMGRKGNSTQNGKQPEVEELGKVRPMAGPVKGSCARVAFRRVRVLPVGFPSPEVLRSCLSVRGR